MCSSWLGEGTTSSAKTVVIFLQTGGDPKNLQQSFRALLWGVSQCLRGAGLHRLEAAEEPEEKLKGDKRRLLSKGRKKPAPGRQITDWFRS